MPSNHRSQNVCISCVSRILIFSTIFISPTRLSNVESIFNTLKFSIKFKNFQRLRSLFVLANSGCVLLGSFVRLQFNLLLFSFLFFCQRYRLLLFILFLWGNSSIQQEIQQVSFFKANFNHSWIRFLSRSSTGVQYANIPTSLVEPTFASNDYCKQNRSTIVRQYTTPFPDSINRQPNEIYLAQMQFPCIIDNQISLYHSKRTYTYTSIL